LLVRDGTVETMEGTDARDEEDHLRPVRALPASDREAAAGESSERPLLETHASTNRRRGINIPHHEGGGSRPGTPRGIRTSKWRYAARGLLHFRGRNAKVSRARRDPEVQILPCDAAIRGIAE